jgi:hypothetical protein
LRVDESWLARSAQQPQITEPRLLTRGMGVDNKYGFSFAVVYGRPADTERGARVTVQCSGGSGVGCDYGKVQFDVFTGTQCRVENLVVSRDSSLFLLVSATPVIASAAQSNEKILTFFFVIFLSPAVKGETNISLVMGESLTLVPELAVVEKPKRPRGRPRAQRPDSPPSDDGSHSSSTTTKSPKKKRPADSDATTAADKRAKTEADKVDEPRPVQRYLSLDSIEPNFSAVAKLLEEGEAKKVAAKSLSGLLRRTESVLPQARVVVESQ